MLPVAETRPPVIKLPAVMLPVPEIAPPLPPVIKLPPVMLPLVDIGLVPKAAKLAATFALP